MRFVVWLVAMFLAWRLVLAVEEGPMDPRRQAAAGATPARSSFLVYAPSGWTTLAVADLALDPLGPTADGLPAGLFLFGDSPTRAAGFERILGAVAQAEVRGLTEPCVVEGLYRGKPDPPQPAGSCNVSFPDLPDGAIWISWQPHMEPLAVAVYGTWDVADLLGKSREFINGSSSLVDRLRFGSLAASAHRTACIAVGTPYEQHTARLLIRSCHHARGLPYGLDEPVDAGSISIRFHATHHFHVLEDNAQLTPQITALWGDSGEHFGAFPSGFVLMANHQRHLECAQLLNDTRVVRSVREMYRPRKAGADYVRTALGDDDPLICRVATRILADSWTDLSIHSEANLTCGLPHRCDPESSQALSMLSWRLPPAERAREIAGWTRTTIDSAAIGPILGEAFKSPDSTVRQAGMEGMVSRLPVEAFQLLEWSIHSDPSLRSEREQFLTRLVDRLWEDATQGKDLDRVGQITILTLGMVRHGLFSAGHPASSRLAELGGWFAFEPAYQGQFHNVSLEGLAAAALERMHDSDPEVRRRAAGMAAAYVSDRGLLHYFEIDPFTTDLYQQYNLSRPGGFF